MNTIDRRCFLIKAGTSATAASVVGWMAAAPIVQAADEPIATEEINRAITFLKSRQEPNGGWSTQREVGITAIVLTGLLRSRRVTTSEPTVTKALAWLQSQVGAKGGVNEDGRANYATSISLMAFHEANKLGATRGRYTALIGDAQKFLKSIQWDDSKKADSTNPYYGGAGYKQGNSRPDLSNTAFFMEALRDTGLPADDPALKKALIFVSRCQNLKSEFNDQPFAGEVNDGGFIYATARGGESIAGKDEKGALRSYASMTYAGLKSMIYAGLTPDDPRAKAALAFISKNYSLDENPGLGQQGLYYYYMTFAKALAVLNRPTLTDASGRVHDWRKELVAALAKRQNADGSWVNPADRFMEGDPNLVTGYALLALTSASAVAE